MLRIACLALIAAVALADYYDLPEATRRGMLGTRMDVKGAMTQGVKVEEMSEIEAMETLSSMPTNYDAAAANSQCANTINFIKDQAACGSCWAVAATSMLADRFCIKCGYGAGANNNMNTNGMRGQVPNEQLAGFELSGNELMSCCRYCGDGCQGGYPIDAVRYAYAMGYVSGGWYGSRCGCQSYQIPPGHHSLYPTPACQRSCDQSSYPETQMQDRHKVSRYYYTRGEAKMMKEIKNNGPIECAFTVFRSFEDFFRDPANKKKVYMGGEDEELGGHAIKIAGWGEQMQDGKNVKFWLIHNSWNITWGDSGMFRYVRGHDLFGMESQCVAAEPACSTSPPNGKQFMGLQCQGRDFN